MRFTLLLWHLLMHTQTVMSFLESSDLCSEHKPTFEELHAAFTSHQHQIADLQKKQDLLLQRLLQSKSAETTPSFSPDGDRDDDTDEDYHPEEQTFERVRSIRKSRPSSLRERAILHDTSSLHVHGL